MSNSPRVILASGSRHRRALLARLQLPFQALAPDIDESARAGERPQALALRLAEAKARAIAVRPDITGGAAIIGSDQVAECDGQRLGKPGHRQAAETQLARASGREVRFHTAAFVLDSASGDSRSHVDLTVVRFRPLDAATIAAYLDLEDALDCAAAFKSEGLGIALLQALTTSDPTALVGLPLIWLTSALRAFGIHVPPAPVAARDG